MAQDLIITGLDQLTVLGARLKRVGAGELRLELLRGLREGAKPLIKEAHQAAHDKLSKHGGLNVRVANEPISVRNRLTGGAEVGVRIVTTTTDTRGANRGTWRHPVHGHRDRWVTQEYEPAKGWFTDTLAAGAPEVQAKMLLVMESVAAKLVDRRRLQFTARGL